MISHLHGKLAPFELQDGIVYFHDWRHVFTGGLAWGDAEGNLVPLMGTDPYPPVRVRQWDMPLGIELVAQTARKTEPVITSEQAGEMFIFGGTVMRDGGVYRLWYGGRSRDKLSVGLMLPAEGISTYAGKVQPMAGHQRIEVLAGEEGHVRYAESDDGFSWRFPALGVLEIDGARDHNIVYRRGVEGGHVFIDTSAPPSERYKMVYRGAVGQEQFEKYRRERPGDIDPGAVREGGAEALLGAVSADGLHWTPISDPLVVQFCDVCNVCEYDAVRQKYVAYVRSWYFNRRTIGQTESDEFGRFPLPREVFWPSAAMKPYESWYANGKTRIPDTQTYHVMFPMRWSLLGDRFDFHLAASPDNVVWGLVPGGPVCEPGEPGTWDAGVVVPAPELVELPGDRWGLHYVGTPLPHKHPRRPPFGALGWAWWPRGRLVALRASETGSFAIWPLRTEGRTVRLNFQTPMSGLVKVEVVGPDGEALTERSFDACDPLSGDHLDSLVTWHGEADIGLPAGAPVRLRFELRRADLFSVRFV